LTKSKTGDLPLRRFQSGAEHGDLILKPLAHIDRIAALIPPPRIHRHRDHVPAGAGLMTPTLKSA